MNVTTMTRIRAGLLFLAVLLFAAPAAAEPSVPSATGPAGTGPLRTRAEQVAIDSYKTVRYLIRSKAYFNADHPQLRAIGRAVRQSRDPAARVAAYREATDAMVAVLKQQDRWALVEEPAANARRIAPPANNVTTHRLPGDVAVVKIRRFRGPVGRDLERALQTFKSQGPMMGLVLDLRGNGGGLVSEAVAVLSQFLPKEQHLFVQEYGQAGRPYQSRAIQTDPAFSPDLETPFALLVNERSASSSELITGVLKDYERARVFGEPTYGKGVGQIPRMLADGRSYQQTEMALKLPATGVYHGSPLSPDETSVEAEARLAKDGRIRLRGDQLMRGALVYLWETRQADRKTVTAALD